MGLGTKTALNTLDGSGAVAKSTLKIPLKKEFGRVTP